MSPKCIADKWVAQVVLAILFSTNALARNDEKVREPPSLFTLHACEAALVAAEKADESLSSKETISYERKALELCKKQRGPSSRLALIASDNLAISYFKLGRFADSDELRKTALRLRRATLGSAHPATIDTIYALVDVAIAQGQLDRALSLRKEAYDLRKNLLGSNHKDTLQAHNDLALSFFDLGNWLEAARIHDEVLQMRQSNFGANNLDSLESMANLASAYWALERHQEALALREKVYAAHLNFRGERDRNTLVSMSNLANSYESLGRDRDALELREKNFLLRRQEFGEEDEDTLASLNNLAISYQDFGRYRETLDLMTQAVEILKHKSGAKNPATLSTMATLANLQADLGMIQKAFDTRFSVLEDRIQVLGSTHPATLNSINDLANSFSEMGRYDEALKLRMQVVADREKFLGAGHPDTISALNNLAESFEKFGRLSDALVIRQRVFRFRRQKLGENNPQTISSLFNLAGTYENLGRTQQAQKIYKNIVKIRQDSLGFQHPDTFSALNNLANSYSNIGRFQDALLSYNEILVGRVQVLGEHHPEVMSARSNVAYAYRKLGRLNEALNLNTQVLRDRIKILGADHLDTITSKRNLARALEDSGQLEEALKINKDVFEARGKLIGLSHPNTLGVLENIIHLEFKLDRWRSGLDYVRIYINSAEKWREQTSLSSNDRRQLFAEHANAYKTFARYMATAANGAISDSEAKQLRNESFLIADRSKARTLVESIVQRDALRAGILAVPDVEALDIADREQALLDEKIARREITSDPGDFLLQELESRRNEVLLRRSKLILALQEKSEKFSLMTNLPNIALQPTSQVLKSNEALISFLIDDMDRVGAWLVTSTTDPFYLSFGECAVELKSLVVSLRKSISHEDTRAQNIALKRLAQLIILPLESFLSEKSHWIISPDKELALLPFSAFSPVRESLGGLTTNQHNISFVQNFSMLTLLRARADKQEKLRYANDLLAVGNAVYVQNRDGEQALQQKIFNFRGRESAYRKILVGTASDSKLLSKNSESYLQQQLLWRNLPWTAKEIAGVKKAFVKSNRNARIVTRLGRAASETELKRLDKSGILSTFRYMLFSAHGYLALNPELSSVVLSLDGADDESDGYVTAAEWSRYNLASELMVVSACDTAVGESVSGEGILGLPFALFVAGNRSTLLTLWPVNDQATAAFVTRFFQKILAGKSHAAALQETQRWMRVETHWHAARYWAGFVLYGG